MLLSCHNPTPVGVGLVPIPIDVPTPDVVACVRGV